MGSSFVPREHRACFERFHCLLVEICVCGGEELMQDLTWCPRNFLHRFRLELPGPISQQMWA